MQPSPTAVNCLQALAHCVTVPANGLTMPFEEIIQMTKTFSLILAPGGTEGQV